MKRSSRWPGNTDPNPGRFLAARELVRVLLTAVDELSLLWHLCVEKE